MPSLAEKKRRITASKKRKAEAENRYEKFTKQAQEAHAEIEREVKMIEWLEGMPVDDEGDTEQVAQEEAE